MDAPVINITGNHEERRKFIQIGPGKKTIKINWHNKQFLVKGYMKPNILKKYRKKAA